jgi:hypothetical protein
MIDIKKIHKNLENVPISQRQTVNQVLNYGNGIRGDRVMNAISRQTEDG